MKLLTLDLSPAARQLIAETMRGREPGSLPALFLADASSTFDPHDTLVREDGPHWYIGVYTRAQVDQLAAGYAEQGQVLVYSVGDLALCIPQSQLVAGLAGNTLEAGDGHVWVVVRPRPS